MLSNEIREETNNPSLAMRAL